jgi:hypothetical protein
LWRSKVLKLYGKQYFQHLLEKHPTEYYQTFVNFMCLQVSCAVSIKKWRKIRTKNEIQSWPVIYKPGEETTI